MKLTTYHKTVLPAVLLAACGARAQYTVTALPLLPGGTESIAYDINNAGVATGEAVYNNQHRYLHAVRWSGGTVTNLGQVSSAGFYSFGFGINDAGLIVGNCDVGSGFSTVPRGIRMANPGVMTQLPGTLRSQANAVNGSGQIVGSNSNGQVIAEQPVIVPAIWNPPAYAVQNLGGLGGRYSEATAINDSGLIVGRGLLLNGPMHAFSMLPPGSPVDLGTLGGRASEAYSVNNAGRVVGWAELPSGARHAVFWEGAAITDLGTLPGAAASEAHAVNTGGDIVGTSWVAGQGPRAWVRNAAGEMTDLNTAIPGGAGWVLQYARGINDSGQIVGQGRLNGKTRGFLLAPDDSCYPDCNLDGALTVADFGCFQTRFVFNDPYADCNASGTLTVADFGCFQTRFVGGCP